ncbi:MarR family transcriptional regulator [uncultured Clostridium sp.]|uniref:MarR family winged helix-turn-helix transcriptional regulator n=1 Tax=uncultured Clostridium sp. TaxID=59620 RepID=UPI0026391023|nr:MarR family transcriptional regulator [uncultured Clostridium sp.]
MHQNNINKSFDIAILIKDIDSTIYSSVLKQLKKFDLTPQQMNIMRYLGHKREMTVSEICEAMGLTKGTVSGILNRMDKQGYIIKRKNLEDKRNTYISFTEEGKILAKEVMKYFNEAYEKVFINIESSKLDEFKTILEEISQKIKESGQL